MAVDIDQIKQNRATEVRIMRDKAAVSIASWALPTIILLFAGLVGSIVFIDDMSAIAIISAATSSTSMALTINFKWLLQLIVAVGMVVYGWWQLEARIQSLERNMGVATKQVELLNEERRLAEERHKKEMEAELSLLKTELNINPFSWGNKKK